MTQKFENFTDGKKVVTTLNKMGYMFENLGEYGRAFIEYCGIVDGPVLDVAAAYGTATLPALKKGAYVVANDLDPRHLEILKSRVSKKFINKLELRPGRFPTELDFPAERFSGILVSHVWHFLTGDEVLESIDKMYKWLRPNGKIFITVGTPYVKIVEKFIPTFLKLKSQGVDFPGAIQDITIYKHPRSNDLPKFMNFMDEDVVKALFEKTPFIIERIGLDPRPDFPLDMQLDGRETVGVIVRKHG